MPLIRLNDVDLYFEVHGPSAPANNCAPLLLLAGLGSDSQSWLTVLEPLAAERQIVLLDNRGCGRTAPQDCRTEIELMADDCIALADHLGIAHFDLLGHSMGGLIAIDCALRHPERITRLVLANTAARNSVRNDCLFSDWAAYRESSVPLEHWLRNFFYWIFTPAFFDDSDTVAEFLRLNITYPYLQSPAGFRSQVLAMHGFDRSTELSRAPNETLVLYSEMDMVFPPGADAAGLAGIPNAKIVSIPGMAHALHVEAPQLFLDPVLAFLS